MGRPQCAIRQGHLLGFIVQVFPGEFLFGHHRYHILKSGWVCLLFALIPTNFTF
jgi:hypothetical protein